MATDNNCATCFYSRYLRSIKMNCCNFYFMTGQRRPCPSGDGCTVKVAYRKRIYPNRKKEVSHHG